MILQALLCVPLIAPTVHAEEDHRLVGGVVSSREWKVRRAPGKEEEFSGDVRYRNAGTSIRADWALYRHATGIWEARRGVKVTRHMPSGDVVEAEGAEASFNQKSEQGTMTGPEGVNILRTPVEGEPDRGLAERADWRGKGSVSLSGRVHFWGPRLETWSDRADYDHAAGKLTLAGGRPVLRKLEGDWTGAVKADQIAAWDNPRRIAAEGSAKGWIEFKRESRTQGGQK